MRKHNYPAERAPAKKPRRKVVDEGQRREVLSVRLPADLISDIRRAAQRDGKSLTKWVEAALRAAEIHSRIV